MAQDEQKRIVYRDRRYVGSKETLSYILFDVLHIDFYYLAIVNFINIIWGIINDAVIVPKFFYDLGGEKKEKMYEELLVRRAATQKVLSDAENGQQSTAPTAEI